MKPRLLTIALTFFLTSAPASGLGGGETLSVGMKMFFESLSPTDSNTRQTLLLCHNWADTLVYRDPAGNGLVPCLAESYRVVDEGTLEFVLKENIRFHNGEPLTAEAVRFSMELFKGPDTLTRKLFRAFEGVSVIDERTVRIKTSLHPKCALEILANTFFIFPPRYYRSAGRRGFGRQPVGTGPYRFVSWEAPDVLRFEANPDYFGPPKRSPGIPNLEVRIIPEEMLRIEALLSGEVDLLRGGSVSPEQVQFLEANHEISVRRADVIRNYFVIMDARGRSGVDYFKDVRVRRAVNHAIDRQRIVETILRGCARVNHSPTTPQHFGYEPDVHSYAYDPEKAGALLAEAGYADGFSVDFYAVRDESDAEAVVRDLRAVGIQANMKWMGGRWDLLHRRLEKGEIPIAFINWGSYSVFDASAALNPFFLLDEPLCYGSTPEIDRILRLAETCNSQTLRKQLFSRAQKEITRQAFWAPLYYGNSVAAMRSDLDFRPSHDELDRYFLARWRNDKHHPGVSLDSTP